MLIGEKPYDMEETADNKLMYTGGIAVGAASMLVAPWATAPLLSLAAGACSTLYGVDQADQGNQIYVWRSTILLRRLYRRAVIFMNG